MNEFFKAIRSFLTEYLPKQRCFSENTIRSYRQALNLLVSFLRTERNLTPEKITFDVFNKSLLLDFLDWLETARACGACCGVSHQGADHPQCGEGAGHSRHAFCGDPDLLW